MAGEQYRVGRFVTPAFLGGLDLNNSALFDRTDELGEYLPGNYSANENIYAGYVMADVSVSDKLSGIVGLRVEATNIDYSGFLLDVDNETFSEEAASQNYTNFMPGLHLNYNFSDYSISEICLYKHHCKTELL